jgi:hypothetical protein
VLDSGQFWSLADDEGIASNPAPAVTTPVSDVLKDAFGLDWRAKQTEKKIASYLVTSASNRVTKPVILK